MGNSYILDTNAVIDYVGNRLPDGAALAMDKLIDEELNTSIIVKIETLGYNGNSDEMLKLKEFLDLANLFYIDDAIANKTIDLRKTYKKLKLGDAIIAATALAYGLTLITRNTKDFNDINGLNLLNPYE